MMYIKAPFKTLREFTTRSGEAYRLVCKNSNQNPTYSVLYRIFEGSWEAMHMGSRKHCVEKFNEYMRLDKSVNSFKNFQDS